MASAAELQDIEYFAGLLYTDQELSIIIGQDLAEMRVQLKEGTSDIAKAILRGRFLRESRLRHSELSMAEAGSSPAQAAARGLLDRMRSR